ncbi:MAG: ATP-binding cassette domain-containing protein [Eubacteriales bacterium]|nr:ATP-binding cassette domain-containing protein [Eubacteriales bacterium]
MITLMFVRSMTGKNRESADPEGYCAKEVLREQSFEIRDGEFLVLVGPSGSGKTTVLKMLNRLIEVTKSSILIDGTRQNELDIRQLRLSKEIYR